jgi:hypothetical protein
MSHNGLGQIFPRQRATHHPKHSASPSVIDWAEIFAAENPRAIDRLASAVFVNCSDPRSRLMAMFSAFFDASGNAKDQPFVVVSGYLANYLQWKLFEQEWEACHHSFGVDMPFHMVDFVAACESPTYKSQRNARMDYVELAKDPSRAAAFIKQLSGVQVAYVHCGISCIVPMNIYEQANSRFELRDQIPPYALGARMCIQRVQQWGKSYGVRERPELIFEAGDFEQGKFTQLMVDEGEPLPVYKKKKEFAGFQGADQYAWEQSYFLKAQRKGMGRAPRPMFQWILQGIPKLHTHAPLEFLINLCRAKGIQPTE